MPTTDPVTVPAWVQQRAQLRARYALISDPKTLADWAHNQPQSTAGLIRDLLDALDAAEAKRDEAVLVRDEARRWAARWKAAAKMHREESAKYTMHRVRAILGGAT